MDEQVKKNKGGRPRTDLDFDLIRNLAKIGCSLGEIANIAKTTVTTLERRAQDVIHEGWDDMKQRLRCAQLQSALSGNPTMLIWLGKQLLGQRDEKFIDKNVTVEKSGKTMTPEEIKEKLAKVMQKKFGIELDSGESKE